MNTSDQEHPADSNVPDVDELINYRPEGPVKSRGGKSNLTRYVIIAAGVLAVGLIVLGLMQLPGKIEEEDINIALSRGEQSAISGVIRSIDPQTASFVIDSNVFEDGGEYIVTTDDKTKFFLKTSYFTEETSPDEDEPNSISIPIEPAREILVEESDFSSLKADAEVIVEFGSFALMDESRPRKAVKITLIEPYQ